jgi:hypothetical protein
VNNRRQQSFERRTYCLLARLRLALEFFDRGCEHSIVRIAADARPVLHRKPHEAVTGCMARLAGVGGGVGPASMAHIERGFA